MSLTYGFIVKKAICSAACWTVLANFCQVQERADQVGASGPAEAKALLARTSLESDDNHV